MRPAPSLAPDHNLLPRLFRKLERCVPPPLPPLFERAPHGGAVSRRRVRHRHPVAHLVGPRFLPVTMLMRLDIWYEGESTSSHHYGGRKSATGLAGQGREREVGLLWLTTVYALPAMTTMSFFVRSSRSGTSPF